MNDKIKGFTTLPKIIVKLIFLTRYTTLKN